MAGEEAERTFADLFVENAGISLEHLVHAVLALPVPVPVDDDPEVFRVLESPTAIFAELKDSSGVKQHVHVLPHEVRVVHLQRILVANNLNEEEYVNPRQHRKQGKNKRVGRLLLLQQSWKTQARLENSGKQAQTIRKKGV